MKNTSEKLIEKTNEMMNLAFEGFEAKDMKNLDEKQFKMVKTSLEIVDIAIEFQEKWVEHMNKQDEKLDKIMKKLNV